MINPAVHALETMVFHEREQWMKDNPEYYELILVQAMCFPAVVLPDVHNPALVCGVVIDDRVGELWMICGEDFDLHVKSILAQQKSLALSMIEAFSLTELRIALRPDRDDAKRWARGLGFVYDRPGKSFTGEAIEYWTYPIQQRSFDDEV